LRGGKWLVRAQCPSPQKLVASFGGRKIGSQSFHLCANVAKRSCGLFNGRLARSDQKIIPLSHRLANSNPIPAEAPVTITKVW